MGSRHQVVNRIIFTNEQKKEMLKKSKFRCCHCGKKLSIGDNFSVEHVIPISKGGSNNPDNTIALCQRCNLLKGNMIYNPEQFYKFLNKADLQILLDNMEDYFDKFEWFNRYNLFPYDILYFDYVMDIKIGGKLAKGGVGKYPVRKVVLKKAIDNEHYSDYYRIYDFVEKYNKAFGIKTEGLRSVVDRAINDGCCYYLTFENSEDIIMVLPVKISYMGSGRTPTIHIRNILTFKNSTHVGHLMAEIVDRLISEFTKIAEEYDCKVVPFFLEVNKEQTEIVEVFNDFFFSIHPGHITYTHKYDSDYDSTFDGMNCLAVSGKVTDYKEIDIEKELEKYKIMADEKLAEPMGMRWKNA